MILYMKKLLFILMLLISMSASAQIYKSVLYDNIDYDYLSEFEPLASNGDSVLIALTDMDFKYGGEEFGYWDIIINKELAGKTKNIKEILKENSDGISLISSCKFNNTYARNEFISKLQKKCPWGYIDSWSFTLNSVGGVNSTIKYINVNKKTIKYITFYIKFTNSVGDVCKNTISGESVMTMICIGPIKIGEKGVWSNNNPDFYNSAIDTGKMIKCVIQYMDDSTITLIKNLCFGDNCN